MHNESEYLKFGMPMEDAILLILHTVSGDSKNVLMASTQIGKRRADRGSHQSICNLYCNM